MKQQFTSKNTIANHNRVPALFKKINWIHGTVNLDIGGGPYNTATNYLSDMGVSNLIFDPYNRSDEHNQIVRNIIKINKPNTSTLSNVLCVIKEKEVRIDILNFAKNNSDMLFISVYSGSGNGIGNVTRNDCWQENRKLNSYMEEIQTVFLHTTVRKNMIIAWNTDDIQIGDLVKKYIK
jgi:hypothetical protein